MEKTHNVTNDILSLLMKNSSSHNSKQLNTNDFFHLNCSFVPSHIMHCDETSG